MSTEQQTRSVRTLRPQSLELGKLPPQALDLEEAVLGAIMLEKSSISNVSFLTSDTFYSGAHQEIFKAIMDLYIGSHPIDMRTVVNQLRNNGTIELVGGAHYIAELTSRVSSAANIEYHARILLELAMKRVLIRMAGELLRDAYEETQDVFELIQKGEMEFFKLNQGSGKRGTFKDGVQLGSETLAEIAERMSRKDGLSGVSSGFSTVDKITHGWQKGELIIIAARPGMGKTSLELSTIEHLIAVLNIPVGIFSLEMRDVELMTRLYSINTQVDSEKIKKGKITSLDYTILLNSKVASKCLFVDDTAGLGIIELKSKARQMVELHKVQIIIVDYLQLLKLENHKGNREQEVSAISRALKEIAKELNIPVIAIAQLSRAVENRAGDKRPMLSDLRESGSIEQDADVVAFLYRPEYYKITVNEEGLSTQGEAELIFAKHRNGRLDTAKIRFIAKYTKFLDYENSFDKGHRHESWGKDEDYDSTNDKVDSDVPNF